MSGASGASALDLTVAGIPIAALIVGLVQVALNAGLPRRWAPALAAGLGLLAGLAVELVTRDPGLGGWIDAALVGLWIGLGAVGGHATVTKTNAALTERGSDGSGS